MDSRELPERRLQVFYGERAEPLKFCALQLLDHLRPKARTHSTVVASLLISSAGTFFRLN